MNPVIQSGCYDVNYTLYFNRETYCLVGSVAETPGETMKFELLAYKGSIDNEATSKSSEALAGAYSDSAKRLYSSTVSPMSRMILRSKGRTMTRLP